MNEDKKLISALDINNYLLPYGNEFIYVSEEELKEMLRGNKLLYINCNDEYGVFIAREG